MSTPTLTPVSQVSAIVLPATGTASDVASGLPLGVYSSNTDFLSGAANQVNLTYRMLGGDVLDIELKADNVYAAYEIATLEYSYIINLHQSKNSLGDLLGSPTGTFDHLGVLKDGQLKTLLSGTSVSLKYPKFNINAITDMAQAYSTEAQVGGQVRFHTASLSLTAGQQDYDLQAAISASASTYGISPDARITVRRVYYKTPRAMWRFYGYYGGLNSVGNLSTYGQYSDDSTFEVIPVWQNKAQAMAYEDSIYTRISHYSYEIRDNIIRLFPIPDVVDSRVLWFDFTVDSPAYTSGNGILLDDLGNVIADTGTAQQNGVNNMNTLPFDNIPYVNINSMGKQWIRRYALAVAKEMLGIVRSKFSVVPIPGESVTLDGPALISSAKEEREKLKEELATILDETTYSELLTKKTEDSDKTMNILSKAPFPVFVG